MTRRPRKKPAGTLLKSLYIWHRWIGLTAVVFIIILAATGLALNHTEELQLDERSVQSDALLDWYGIQAPDTLTSYRAGPLTLTEIGNRIFSNTTEMQDISAPLLGAVIVGELVVAAADNKLLLLTTTGELVEKLDGAAGVPAGLQAIGKRGKDIVFRSAHGYYRTDIDFSRWVETDAAGTNWSTPAVPDEILVAGLQAAWRGNGLPLERVVLDLHSGRILGPYGVWIMDAAAVLCILLGLSGVWLWVKRRISARAHRRKIATRRRQMATQRNR